MSFVIRRKGIQDSVYDIPFSETLALSRRFIAISPDGDVYFLRTGTSEVDLIGVGSRPVHAGDVIDNPNLPRLSRSIRQDSKGADRSCQGPHAPTSGGNRVCLRRGAVAFDAPRSTVRIPDTACSGFNRIRRPGYLAGKLNQEGSECPLLLGLSRLTEPVPRQHRQRHASRQRLHAQQSAPGRDGCRLFGFCQRSPGDCLPTSPPPPFRASPSNCKTPGTFSRAMRSTNPART